MTEAEILPHLTEWHKAMIDPDRNRQHAEQTLEAYKQRPLFEAEAAPQPVQLGIEA